MSEFNSPAAPPPHPTFAGALAVWIKIGLLSFGGPTGQIALMHRELVERRRWISDSRFLHALNYCMLLPGPEAQQLAIYTGWLLHRVRGGITAGALFVLPGALVMWLVAAVYVVYGDIPAIEAAFYGLKPAVMAIVFSALLRIGKRTLRNPVMWSIAAASFLAIFAGDVSFPLIIVTAGLIGLAGGKFLPTAFHGSGGHAVRLAGDNAGYVITEERSGTIQAPSLPGTLLTIVLWGVLWVLPVAGCYLVLGGDHLLSQQGLFFSKAALVTFGGAYAVLPYVAQQAVEVHGWLSATQMMDGLGLAETTPGPLILVLQFTGFLGGWNEPGSMPPLVMATLAAGLTTWVAFLPGFLFIFAGAPWMEQCRDNHRLNTALTAVTAAVVGVILNLAVWFGGNVIMPSPGTVDWFPVVAALFFVIAQQWWKWDVLWIVAGGGLLGLIVHAVGIQGG